MRILFLDAYFEPEQIAFTHLENDLLGELVNAGHEVDIVCPTPTRGVSVEIVQEYRNKKIRRETLYNGHVHVTRFSAPQEGKNPIIRAIRYFWCNLRTYQIGKKIEGADVVFANSTPPTQGWIAGKVAKKIKIPFVYSLQDIFPDSLVTTGLTQKDSLLWKIGRKLEDATYRQCSKIIVIADSMKANLLEKGVNEDKITVISNWIDLNTIYPVSSEGNSVFDEYSISRERFTVLYAGNFGAAQGAEIVLDAAEGLQGKSEIQFVIFGGGSGYDDVEERAKALDNVVIHRLLPQDRVSEVYSIGDIALITSQKGVGKCGMPSKTWSIMACNTPIIASFDQDSDLAEVLEKSGAGKCVEPGDVKELTQAIIDAYNMWKTEGDFCIDSRSYIIQNASKEVCTSKYINVISNVTDKNVYINRGKTNGE